MTPSAATDFNVSVTRSPVVSPWTEAVSGVSSGASAGVTVIVSRAPGELEQAVTPPTMTNAPRQAVAARRSALIRSK